MRVKDTGEMTRKEKKIRGWKGAELVQEMWLKMETRLNHKGGRENINATTFPWLPGQALKTFYGEGT